MFAEAPEEEVEEQGVEVAAGDDGSCKPGELTPQLGLLSVPNNKPACRIDMQYQYLKK